MGYRIDDGWRKVSESGSSYVTATLFNVRTGEEASVVVRDYDRWDLSECDAPEWYNVAIDDDARKAYCRKHMIITDGSRVMVIKGRKVPVGTTGIVDRMKKIYDRYGRHCADYVVFESGAATNVDNCVLIV